MSSLVIFISVHLRVITFQCNRKERKAIQPLGADLHRHKPGRPMLNHPSFIIAALKLCKIINATHATNKQGQMLKHFAKKCSFSTLVPTLYDTLPGTNLRWETHLGGTIRQDDPGLKKGIRDACSSTDIFNGCLDGCSGLRVVYWWSTSGLQVVTKWSPSDLLVVSGAKKHSDKKTWHQLISTT